MEKRFQWSIFTGIDRNEQFVIREDDWKLFVEGRQNVLNLLNGTKGTNKEDSAVISEPKPLQAPCMRCSAPATIKTGVKNGKQWKGVFCTKDKSHVTWL